MIVPKQFRPILKARSLKHQLILIVQDEIIKMDDDDDDDVIIKYGQCNQCGYENTSSSDDCHACGSLDKSFYECTLQEWENEH